MAGKKSNKLDKDLQIVNATDIFSDLDDFKKELRKEYGSSAAIDDDDFVRAFIPTGIDALDYLLGGGIPQGAITEVCGKEGSGKSSFGIHMLGQIQKLGGLAALIDSEGGAGDKYRFETFGVDTSKCIITIEDLAEKVFSQVEKIANYIQKKNITVPSLLVIDSIAGLTTRAEQEADYDSNQVALTARMIKKGLQRTKMLCRETNLAVLAINQVRTAIGVGNSWTGPTYVSSGGDAIKYACISRLFMERGKFIGESKMPDGHIVRTKIIKCKSSAALGRTLPMRLYYNNLGYCNAHIVYDLLNDSSYLGTGAWKTIILPDGTEKKFNSIDTFAELFNKSEENKQHFLKMMKDCFGKSLNFAAQSDVELPNASDIGDISEIENN